ncbi:MAG: hypothetical protein C6W58_18060 [Bacillaceae bacterium]|uniref:hypothetical protein n=1 Tax=Aeribacillus sp. FSL K6-3256 TaxID=2954613 RepID=UPI000E36A515|nr:hypothetical protein [Aeribacillus pallidus]REJ11541.1 MAG: hypothetical protein C6W58_18060 [Bacillaceae bacterium]
MFSVSLDLPEFEVVKQVFLEDCNLLHVEKNTTEERCSYFGFFLVMSMTGGQERCVTCPY